jgi:hypothetical protein
MKHYLACLPILLAACTTTPTIQTVIQRVEVPIATPCKTETPTAPEYNFPKVLPAQDVFDKTKALLADRKLSLGYEAELLAALQSCK